MVQRGGEGKITMNEGRIVRTVWAPKGLKGISRHVGTDDWTQIERGPTREGICLFVWFLQEFASWPRRRQGRG